MSKHCILVIEDQEDLASLYEANLRRAGYKVRSAFTGEEGVAEFKANGADCVLLDMTLPEMSGLQALKEIRALSPDVPVIVVTGETNERQRADCERLGINAYLSKPPDHDALTAAITLALAEPAEEREVVTLRLPKRIVARLTELDANLERAITLLCEQQQATAQPAPQEKAARRGNAE